MVCTRDFSAGLLTSIAECFVNSKNIYDRFSNAGFYLLFAFIVMIILTFIGVSIFGVSFLFIRIITAERKNRIKLLSFYLGLILPVGLYLIFMIPSSTAFWSYIIVVPLVSSFVDYRFGA